MASRSGAVTPVGLLDELVLADTTFGPLSPTPSASPTSSINSGPEGFKNRKVANRDGFLIVSDDEGPGSACTSVMGSPIDNWENVYVKHRDEIVGKDGFIYTPLHIVKELAKKMKEGVHIEHFILKDPANKEKTTYRVDILIGNLRGVGQCTRKQMARQLAAIDMYEKIQLQQTVLGYRPTPIPRCGLLPGWRIDPNVFPMLSKGISADKSLQMPLIRVLPPPEKKPGKFTALCHVGDCIAQAESDHPWLAKRLAAKQMYEAVVADEFPLENTLMGSEVINFPRMKLLGYKPKVTNLKRKWLMEHRIKHTQVVVPNTEPYDGEMEDVEEEVLLQQSKRVKLSELKGTLMVTVGKEPVRSEQSSIRLVTARLDAENKPDPSHRPLLAIKHEMPDMDELILHADDEDELLDME